MSGQCVHGNKTTELGRRERFRVITHPTQRHFDEVTWAKTRQSSKRRDRKRATCHGREFSRILECKALAKKEKSVRTIIILSPTHHHSHPLPPPSPSTLAHSPLPATPPFSSRLCVSLTFRLGVQHMSRLATSGLLAVSHRINNYIEDKATQIVFQLENFMSFWLEFERFYTVHRVHSAHYSTQISPTSPEEDRAHILSKNMDVWDKDKNSLFILLFVGINVETLKKCLAFHSKAPQLASPGY